VPTADEPFASAGFFFLTTTPAIAFFRCGTGLGAVPALGAAVGLGARSAAMAGGEVGGALDAATALALLSVPSTMEGAGERNGRLEVGELIGVGFPACVLIGELALADAVEELDLVCLECTELVREPITFFPFVLLCCLWEYVSRVDRATWAVVFTRFAASFCAAGVSGRQSSET
jgi:hypothetical protein